jgi:hypothetical protein
MRNTRSIWIVESALSGVGVASILVLANRVETSPDESYINVALLCEAVLFTLAFVLARVLGGPGKVLIVGVALAFLFAIVIAILLGEDCTDDSFLCVTPGDAFALGLLVALAFYPGWALGAGVGALARLRAQAGRARSPAR